MISLPFAGSHAWSYETLAQDYLDTFDQDKLKGFGLTGYYYGTEHTTPTLVFEITKSRDSYLFSKKLRTNVGTLAQVIAYDGSQAVYFTDRANAPVHIYPRETDGRSPLAADDIIAFLGYRPTQNLAANAEISQTSDSQLEFVVSKNGKDFTTVIDFDLAGELPLPIKEEFYVDNILHQSFAYSEWRMVPSDNGSRFPIPTWSEWSFYDFATGEFVDMSRLELLDVDIFQNPRELELPDIPKGAPVLDHRVDPPRNYSWGIVDRRFRESVERISGGLTLNLLTVEEVQDIGETVETMRDALRAEREADATPAHAPATPPPSKAEPVLTHQSETDKTNPWLRIALLLSAIVNVLLLVLIGLLLRRGRPVR
ncbi:MAG: hypothetical protein RLY93_04715 [Sumerlaeia bacterium]